MHSLKTKLIAVFLAVFTAFSCVAAEAAEQGAATENTVQETQTVSDSDASGEPGKADESENAAPADTDDTNKAEADEAPSDSDNQTETGTDSTPKQKIPYFVQPSDYLYRAFNEVMNLYVDRHLYEFTREELLEKFTYDIIKKHPEMYEAFLNDLLGTMDKYSGYHESSSGFLSVKSSNAGFGIVLVADGENLKIDKVTTDSLAEKAGLKQGDILRKVMNYDIAGLTLNAVSELLKSNYAYLSVKGEDGKYADYNPLTALTVERDGVLYDFYLQKGVVNREELSYGSITQRDEEIGYIRISSFLSDSLPKEFENAVRDIHANGMTGLIIDLRDNGGGSLDLVTHMAELFVDEGEITHYLHSRDMEAPQEVRSSCKEPLKFEKIAVLVNENTASAAELMASILRNKAGAVLVGKTTYGKALGQSVFNFVAGDTITITTYEVLDANGESYNEKGLIPELALDNVECLYEFPTDLGVFNHQNYASITAGVYSDACLALEKRLVLLGYLQESRADGIWDDTTSLAVRILQVCCGVNAPYFGYLDDATVTRITALVNGYKERTYYEDSQLDVALIYHQSFSQAKRLIAEKQKLAKDEKQKIAENAARLEALDDAGLLG